MLGAGVELQTALPGTIVLRRLTTADADAFARHVARDGSRLTDYLPWPEATATPEGAAGWLGPYERQEDGRVLVAGAWGDGDLHGGALLFHHTPRFATIELGCWVVGGAEGKGVASAACRALIGLARRELAVERVEWMTTTMNARSRRLAERLGFTYEGTLRSAFVLGGVRHDLDVLSLVGEEIDAAAASPPAAGAVTAG
jgi:ribosomal-protein-serine acetyltransferase